MNGGQATSNYTQAQWKKDSFQCHWVHICLQNAHTHTWCWWSQRSSALWLFPPEREVLFDDLVVPMPSDTPDLHQVFCIIADNHCRQSSTTNTIHSRKWCILSLPCHPWWTCPTKVEQWTWKYSRHFIQSKRLLCKDCNAWPSTAWSKLDIWTQRAAEAFKDIQ